MVVVQRDCKTKGAVWEMNRGEKVIKSFKCVIIKCAQCLNRLYN